MGYMGKKVTERNVRPPKDVEIRRTTPGVRPDSMGAKVGARPEYISESDLDVLNMARRLSIRPIIDALGTSVDAPLGAALGIKSLNRPVFILSGEEGKVVKEIRAPGIQPEYIEEGIRGGVKIGRVQLPTDAAPPTAIHEYFHALGAGEVQAYLAPLLFAHVEGYNVKPEFKKSIVNYENDLMQTLRVFVDNYGGDVNDALLKTFKETVGRDAVLGTNQNADLHSIHGKILAALALANGNPIEAYKSAANLDASKAYDLTQKLMDGNIGNIRQVIDLREQFINRWGVLSRFRANQNLNWRQADMVKEMREKVWKAVMAQKLFR